MFVDSTRRDDGVRKWVVDEWIWQFDSEDVSDLTWSGNRDLSGEFLYEVVVEQRSRSGERAKVNHSPPLARS